MVRDKTAGAEGDTDGGDGDSAYMMMYAGGRAWAMGDVCCAMTDVW